MPSLDGFRFRSSGVEKTADWGTVNGKWAPVPHRMMYWFWGSSSTLSLSNCFRTLHVEHSYRLCYFLHCKEMSRLCYYPFYCICIFIRDIDNPIQLDNGYFRVRYYHMDLVLHVLPISVINIKRFPNDPSKRLPTSLVEVFVNMFFTFTALNILSSHSNRNSTLCSWILLQTGFWCALSCTEPQVQTPNPILFSIIISLFGKLLSIAHVLNGVFI